MGSSIPTIPSNFDPYRPYMKLGGRILQMGRGQDTMWAAIAPNNDKYSNKVAWKNGDQHNVDRIQEVLKDRKPRCRTEICLEAGMSRVCATRVLDLMVRQGMLEQARERGATRYSLEDSPEAV